MHYYPYKKALIMTILENATPEKIDKKPEKIDNRPVASGSFVGMEADKRHLTDFDRYVFTSAQNNTHVHTDFLKSLETYCEHNKAQLVIGKFTYNKNGFQNDTKSDRGLHYDKLLSGYLSDKQGDIIPNDLVWCGDLNILPTAKYPLSGLEQYTGKASMIVPHAKIALESVPTAKYDRTKIMYTTGTVTLRNYIAKKAGQSAEPFHSFGALVVEVCRDSGLWFARQVETDESGIFQDLDTVYYPNGATGSARIEAINWGDIHSEKSDPVILDSCFGDGGILDQLNPRFALYHDLFDMEARNHHNRKSGHFLAFQHNTIGAGSVKEDIKTAGSVLDLADRAFCHGYIVESNHDLALESWLDSNEYDFKKDPINAVCYLDLNAHIYRSINKGKDPETLKFSLTGYLKKTRDNFTFLKTDQSLVIAGIEMAMHGHNGVNGSRGNPKTFRKLNMPINTGHTHTCSIHGSVYTAGVTGSLDMGYNVGGSSWSHSHIVTYANGKRAIITQRKIGSSALFRL